MTNINCLASAVQNALTSWQITSQLSASVRGDLGNVSRVSYFSNDRHALRTRTRTHALNTDSLSDAFTDLMTGQLTESTPLVICHSFFSWGMLEVFKDCPEDFFCYYKIFYNERDVWFISSQSERSGVGSGCQCTRNFDVVCCGRTRVSWVLSCSSKCFNDRFL